MNRAERAQERRQERARHVLGIRGAENREGHSAASTGGASDLPELRSQDDLDGSLPPGWWIAPSVALGLIFWGVIAWLIA